MQLLLQMMGSFPGAGMAGGLPATGPGAATGAGVAPSSPDLSALLGLMGGANLATTAPPPVANPQEAYTTQIQQLVDMVRAC